MSSRISISTFSTVVLDGERSKAVTKGQPEAVVTVGRNGTCDSKAGRMRGERDDRHVVMQQRFALPPRHWIRSLDAHGAVRAWPRRPLHIESESAQYLGTNWERSAYLGLWGHSLSTTLKPRSRVSWARSAQGVLGCLAITSFSSLCASAYFLAVSAGGASGFRAWSTTNVIARSGVGCLLGRGGRDTICFISARYS